MMDSTGHPTYHLKRIGKSATVPVVKDVLVLNGDVTRFGRHSGNDHYLDSLELSYFISRWHAEIHYVQDGLGGHGGEYIVQDNSLNGTYINGVRVMGSMALEEGDVIMFGHPHGKDIKPGQAATSVADSEFEFLNAVIHEMTSPLRLESADWSPDRTRPSQRTPTLQSWLSTVSPRRILSVDSDGKFHLKDISNIRCRSPGRLLHLDVLTSPGHAGMPQAVLAATDDSNDSDRWSPVIASQLSRQTACTPIVQSRSPSLNEPSHTNSRPASVDMSTNSASDTETSRHTQAATRKQIPKKRKLKLSRGSKSKARRSKWHSDGDQCDSYDCCLPDNDEISWVQCDDCDKWYHTVCAGCNYNSVKQQTTEFRCGCT